MLSHWAKKRVMCALYLINIMFEEKKTCAYGVSSDGDMMYQVILNSKKNRQKKTHYE